METFVLVYGYKLNQPVDLREVKGKSGKVSELCDELFEIHNQVQKNISEANTRYKSDADQHRRFVNFEVGEFVIGVPERGESPNRKIFKIKG